MTTEFDAAPRDADAARPPGSSRLRAVAAIAVFVVVLAGVAVLAKDQGSGADASGGRLTAVRIAVGSGPAPVVGRAAPDFTVAGLDDKPVTLSSFRGHPVWLTFGASWCQACRAENPDIVAAYTSHQRNGLVVIQVYMSEDQATVSDYAGRVGIPYVKVPDPIELLAAEYRIVGIPTHYFIDASGVLRSMKVGSLTPDAMDAALREIGG